MDFEDFFLAPSKTKHLLDPTSFPTVIPDPPIWQTTGKAGHRTFWVLFVLMTIAFLAFAALSWTVPASKRLFHSLTTLIVLISGLAYLAMATGSGFFFHHYRVREKHDHGVPDTFKTVHRQVYWLRYVEWLLTTPLIITDLVLLAGLNGSNLFSALVANVVVIVSGFFAATAWSVKVKWGWFAIAIIAYLWVVYVLAAGVKVARTTKGSGVGKFYTSIMAYSVILWLAYPIVWVIAAGTKRLSVDGEIIAYAVLDVLTKGVFGGWLLLTYQRLTESHIVVGGFWTHGLNSEGTIRVGDEEEGA
jgi:bacteriorhodopsin